MGSFETTRTQCGGCDSKPKEQGASIGAKFVTWFNTMVAILNPQLKQKAILASWDAATAILMEAQQSQVGLTGASGPCQPKATHGHPPTQLEYRVKTADI